MHTTEPAKSERVLPRRGALVTLSLLMFLSSLGAGAANIALPRIASDLHAPFSEVQWVVLAYLLTITSLVVGVGRLGDVVGRRRLLTMGIAVFTAASIACGATPALSVLIAARVLQGAGGAIMMTLSIAFVADVIEREKTGAAMGVLGTVSAFGTALGPAIGGVLIESFDWRGIFFLQAPLGVAALGLARRYLPKSLPAAVGANFDWPGALLLALTLSAFALAVTVGRGATVVTHVMLLGASLGGLALFVIVERRARAPLVRFVLPRDGPLIGALIANALVGAVMMTTLIVGPFYFTRGLHCDAAIAGLVMASGPIVAAFVAAPAGALVDKIGADRGGLLGLIGAATGCVALAVSPTFLGIVGYVVPLTMLTASYALFQAANNTLLMSSAVAADRGRVSGLAALSRNLGLLMGASVMGALFAIAAGGDASVASASDVRGGMRATFVVATILIALAIGSVWLASARRDSAIAPGLR